MDSNRKPRHEVPMWSETRWGGCYNPDQGVGLYLHAGRYRGNLDWWWAQTAIYLPGGRVAVERSWIRNTCETGVKTSSLDLRALEKGWSADFDGIVEIATTEALGKAPRGAGAPCAPARFKVTADASRPWWDMHAWIAGEQDFADMHVEQMGRCEGTLQVGTETYRLDGVSYYDHSSGVRDWTHFHSHHFGNIAMPDVTIYQIGVYSSPSEARAPIGAWFDNTGKALKIESSVMPRLQNVLGAPHEFEWKLKVEGKKEMALRVEVLHDFPMTVTFDNDNINGVAWDAQGDPLYMIESQVRVTAPDGSVGYGHVERSNRRSLVKP
ncbi:MAG: hypothetical protein ABW034_05135 [Steroidobacteraceae bacterium]